MGFDVEIADIKVYAESFADSPAMAHVAHRFLAAQMEVAMRGAAIKSEAGEYGQQGY
jgi:hypothetical protein